MYDLETISDSLVMGTTLTNKTFIDGKKHNIFPPTYKSSTVTTYENIIESFKRTIEKEVSNADTVALQLSGGKDSRTLLALMYDMGIRPVCLTYSYDDTNPELIIAKSICKKLGLKHKYLKIDPKMYTDKSSIKAIIQTTMGNPNFNTMMLFYGLRKKLEYDVIFNGNLMTEIMDTKEHHWYNGNVKDGIIKKVMSNSLPLVNNYNDVITNFRHRLEKMSTNQLILMANWRRILYLNLWKPTLNFVCPILDSNVLSEIFSLPISERVNSKLTKNIIRILNKDLYNIPCSRSPLPFKYPLWVHQGYAKAFGRKGGKGFDVARYITENIDISQLENIDIDILKQKNIKHYIEKSESLSERWGTIKRLRNLNEFIKNI